LWKKGRSTCTVCDGKVTGEKTARYHVSTGDEEWKNTDLRRKVGPTTFQKGKKRKPVICMFVAK